MIIDRLLLLNFKKYAQETVVFGTGIIGVFGPNGAGKSTLFDAICWCLYGVTPTMGREGATIRQEDLVRDGQEDMGVEIFFEHGGQHYNISRSYTPSKGVTARVRTAGKEVARSSKDVSQFITSLLGLDAKAFIAASFIRQKEIDLLTSQRPGKRKDIINRLFGLQLYDQLLSDAKALQQESVQEEIRIQARITALTEEQRSLTAAISAYGDIASAVADARRDVAAAERRLTVSDTAVQRTERRYDAYLELEKKRDQAREQLRMTNISKKDAHSTLETLSDIENRIENNEQLLRKLECAASELGRLDEEKQRWEDARVRLESTREAHNDAIRRNSIAIKTATAARDAAEHALSRAREAYRAAEQASADAERRKDESAMPGDALTAEKQRESKIIERIAHERAKRDALGAKRQEIAEERESLYQLGDAAECPLCHQRLPDDHVAKVEASLDASLRAVDEKMGTLASRIGHLQNLLEDQQLAIKDIESRIAAAEQAVAQYERAHGALQLAAERVGGAERERDRAGSALSLLSSDAEAEEAELRRRCETLEQTVSRSLFDIASYERAHTAASELAKASARHEHLLGEMGRKTDLRLLMDGYDAAIAELNGRVSSLERDMQALQIERHEVEQARREARSALEARSSLREALSELQEKERSVRALDHRLEQCTNQLDGARSELSEIRETIRDYEVLKSAFKDIPVNVHERLKPAIQEEVSSLLDGLTHGKYSAVRISDDYTLEVLYNGMYYPIYRFSGGEKDLINLCLRIGISHVLVSLSKTQGVVRMDSLFLDETFSSLDAERRQMLMGALMSLKSFFSQIVIITHVEDIKEALPRSYEISEDQYGVAALVPL